jgi:hypothetical protein
LRSWCHLAADRVRPIVLAIVLAVPCVATAKEEGLESACHSLLHRYVLDCGCTAKFLEDHFGAEQADILLKLRVYGVNGDNRGDVLNLYLQHGANKINEAVMEFHRQRDQLRVYCVQGEGPMIAD